MRLDLFYSIQTHTAYKYEVYGALTMEFMHKLLAKIKEIDA